MARKRFPKRRAAIGEMPAYRKQAPHRHRDRPSRDAGGVCRICTTPVAGKTRRGRFRRLHDGRLLPDGTREPRCNQEPGVCRVCAQPVAIGKNGRPRFWHDGRTIDGSREPDCLQEHKMRFNPSFAKRVVASRDGARCRTCNTARGRAFKWLHLDHILPLKDGGSSEPDNMQLLCPSCHTTKTSMENSDRAARRKESTLNP